jgi:hypothetical protein
MTVIRLQDISQKIPEESCFIFKVQAMLPESILVGKTN